MVLLMSQIPIMLPKGLPKGYVLALQLKPFVSIVWKISILKYWYFMKEQNTFKI